MASEGYCYGYFFKHWDVNTNPYRAWAYGVRDDWAYPYILVNSRVLRSGLSMQLAFAAYRWQNNQGVNGVRPQIIPTKEAQYLCV